MAFSAKHGQGALEYLLLIGGGVLVTVVVLLLVLATPDIGENVLGNNISTYQNVGNNYFSGGGGNVCGDGIIQGSEPCDEDASGTAVFPSSSPYASGNCVDYPTGNYTSGSLLCTINAASNSCALDFINCQIGTPSQCTNGAPDNLCDASESYATCPQDCFCGNGTLESGNEQCDFPTGNPIPVFESPYQSGLCSDYPDPVSSQYVSGSLRCDSASCTVREGLCQTGGGNPCNGNGVCDNGETVALCPSECTCGNTICELTETDVSCPLDCACGNGRIDWYEACDASIDPSYPAPYTSGLCIDYPDPGSSTFGGGSLQCIACVLDVSGCTGTNPTDTTPPTITTFSVDWDNRFTTTTYAGTDASLPVSFVLIRGTNQNTVNAVLDTGPSNSFDNPPAGVTTITLDGSGTYVDAPLVNGTTYYYRLRACDAAPSINCVSTTPSLSAIPHIPTYIATLGANQTVFDQTAASQGAIGELCNNNLDLADTQARAVKFNGQLYLASGNAPNFYMRRGNDFSDLRSICSPVALLSSKSNFAYTFDSNEWLTSIYLQGGIMHGFVHNEYHEIFNNPNAINCNNFPNPGNRCWYNGITYATSADGVSYTQSNPVSVIAASPLPWNANQMQTNNIDTFAHGPMEPGNIIKHTDNGTDYYYMHFRGVQGIGAYSPSGVCVARTTNLSDPTSWRAWNGSSFALTMNKPYDASNNPAPTGLSQCSHISSSNILDAVGSITYNTFMKKYLMIQSGNFGANCGIFYSLSDDLVNWSQARFIAGYNMPGQPVCVTGAEVVAYASYIDHDQLNDPTDPNFEKSDNTGYVYFVRFNNGWGTDRDLVRRSVTWTKV